MVQVRSVLPPARVRDKINGLTVNQLSKDLGGALPPSGTSRGVV